MSVQQELSHRLLSSWGLIWHEGESWLPRVLLQGFVRWRGGMGWHIKKWTNWNMTLIHPFIHFQLFIWVWPAEQQSEEMSRLPSPRPPSPAHPLVCGDTKGDWYRQQRNMFHPACPGSHPSLLPAGDTWNISPRRHPGAILIRCLKHLNWLLSV